MLNSWSECQSRVVGISDQHFDNLLKYSVLVGLQVIMAYSISTRPYFTERVYADFFITVPAPVSAPKLKRPPSPRRAPPKTPPLQTQYPPTATHRADKPRDSAQQREPMPRGLPRESARDGQMRDDRREGRDPFREGGAPHRTASHRQDVQRQGSSRGLPMEASREMRRDFGDMRERDRGHQLQMGQGGHGQSSLQHREGGSRRVGSGRSSGSRLLEDMRLKSNVMSFSGGRNALPPPPRPSESSRVMEGRGGSDARSLGMKPDMKMIPKVSIIWYFL